MTYETHGIIIEDEENKDYVYFLPLTIEVIEQLNDKGLDSKFTQQAFPVHQSFLSEVDFSYIDEGEDRDFFSRELQVYDDQARYIRQLAQSKYKSGVIRKDIYAILKQKLKTIEEDANRIEIELKKRKELKI